MRSFITPVAIVLALSLTMLFTACEKGPAEKAGAQIDQAVENTKDAAKDLKKNVEESMKD
jgi:hypothetical protein